VKAPPIIIPTAISMTLPRLINSLNSFIKFFICLPLFRIRHDDRCTADRGTRIIALIMKNNVADAKVHPATIVADSFKTTTGEFILF
jgi:hypothetical protein